MPAEAVRIVCHSTDLRDPVERNLQAIHLMSETFNVSLEAAVYRLKALRYIRPDQVREYVCDAPFWNPLDIFCDDAEMKAL